MTIGLSFAHLCLSSCSAARHIKPSRVYHPQAAPVVCRNNQNNWCEFPRKPAASSHGLARHRCDLADKLISIRARPLCGGCGEPLRAAIRVALVKRAVCICLAAVRPPSGSWPDTSPDSANRLYALILATRS